MEGRRVKRLRWGAALVGVVALAATLAATERTPLTWDEGDAFVRAERVSAWTRAVVVGPRGLRATLDANDAVSVDGGKTANGAENVGAKTKGEAGERGAEEEKASLKSTQTAPFNDESGRELEREPKRRPRWGEIERAGLEYFAQFDGRRALFSEKAIEAGWPHTVYREGHPAGYSIAIAAGRAFSLRFLPFLSEKAAFRFGPIAFFALALAAVFYRVGRLWGIFAAILAVVGIVAIPRAFGHAQLAGGDSLLISSWLLIWALFDAAATSKRGAIALGAALGASFCAKFSGFTVVAPLTLAFALAASATKRGGRIAGIATAGRFALTLTVAAAIFWAANPPIWTRPCGGAQAFVSLNLRREGFDIPIYFLGKIYSPSRPLPWWNGFFWMATTVPTAILAFAALGGLATATRKGWQNGAVGELGETNAIGKVGGAGEVGAIDEVGAVGKLGVIDEVGWIGETGEDAEEIRGDEENGRGGVGRSGRRAAFLALALAATLPLVRALPGIPTHDGARLLIASFSFVAILAALGATVFVKLCERATEAAFAERARRQTTAVLDDLTVKIVKLERLAEIKKGEDEEGAAEEERAKNWGKRGEEESERDWEEWGARKTRERRKETATAARLTAQAVVALAFAVGVADLIRSAPQYLSFYNATLGGVVGARRRGMEATYYWDAFDAETVAWLNAEIAAARAAGRPNGVLFGSFSSQTLDYYRRWGTIATPEIATITAPNALVNRERFGFYVVQHRPSGWTTLDLALFRTTRPIYRKTTRNPLALAGPWSEPTAENAAQGEGGLARREVVLLEIYDFRDVERVLAASVAASASTEATSDEKKNGEKRD